MRVSKPIILHIPSKLIISLDGYLKKNPPEFKYDIVNFYYVIHYLIIGIIRNKKKLYINIDLKYLKSITVSNIDRYIKILKDNEFILSDNIYKAGEKSLGYKMNPLYVDGIKEIEIKPTSKLFQKIIKSQRKKKANYNQLNPFLYEMKNHFLNIDFDYKGARKWIENNATAEQKPYYLTSLSQLQDKRFRYFKRNFTNKRLDTNLTNLKSELKQFLKGDFVNIDLSNSQPLLASILIDSIINNNSSTLCYYLSIKSMTKTFGIKVIQEVSKIHKKAENLKNMNLSFFNESTKNGLFYDDFITKFEGNISRKEVKDIMFKVLFSKNKSYNNFNGFIPYRKEKEIFKSVYPFVSDVIEILKSKDNRIFPIYLQKIESYIFIDCIAKELVENNIVPLTIHDSIIIEKQDQAKAIKIMNKVFAEQIGIVPTLKIEKL